MLYRTPLETERLLLRPEAEEDFDAWYAMNADAEVMRFIGEGKPIYFKSAGHGFRHIEHKQ